MIIDKYAFTVQYLISVSKVYWTNVHSAFVKMSWFLYPLQKSLIKGVTQRGGDRSAWTDTPEDKERKMMAGEEVRQSSTQYTCTVH